MMSESESETIEFKSAWTDAALQTLAAFANHKGGTLYIGVEDDGTVVGCSWSDADQLRVVNQISAMGLRPQLQWEIRRDKPVLSIQVQPGTMPVAHRGRYFIRVGSSTREMTPDQLARRVLDKLGQTWDALPSGVEPSEVDIEAVRSFMRLARERLPRLSPEDTSDHILTNLNLIRDGWLTNAGVLLFVSNPQRFFPGAQVHIGRFAELQVLDDRTLDRHLWAQLDRTLETLRGYFQVRFDIRAQEASLEGIQRRDVWEYPLEAVRECVINALIHRDYTVSGEIQIRVERDQFKVWSPGLLPEGVSVADLQREGHVSRPRNPLLAQVFYYAGLIERWGVGTTLMQQACAAQGLADPLFVEEMGGFTVTFSQNLFSPELLERLGLNDRQLALVEHVKATGFITNSVVQRLTGVSKATATRDLDGLVQREILVRQGRTGRGLRYVLKGS